MSNIWFLLFRLYVYIVTLLKFCNILLFLYCNLLHYFSFLKLIINISPIKSLTFFTFFSKNKRISFAFLSLPQSFESLINLKFLMMKKEVRKKVRELMTGSDLMHLWNEKDFQTYYRKGNKGYPHWFYLACWIYECFKVNKPSVHAEGFLLEDGE